VEFLVGWLRDYVDLSGLPGGDRPGTAPELVRALAETLTSIGLAVESTRELDAASGGPDAVLDVEVTSNRPDAMCHLGLARELAAKLGVPLVGPSIPLYGSLSTDGSSGPVVLEDPEGCPRYVARTIRGVRVGPSPEWLVRRLEAIGSRSINNVVDATNYVLWELGQPLHAFDLGTLPGGEVRVRRARAGERLRTLDGKERELDPEVLVIADRSRAIGLAGVMGGLATEVTEGTADVLLESAHFDRRRVRIGAKRLAVHTDASHRFERGADFERCDEASRRCAALIVELAGGTVEERAVDAVAKRPARVRWQLDAAALERFAGCAVPDAETERILGALGFAPRRTDAHRQLAGEVPSWRAVDFEPRRAGAGAGRFTYPQDVYEEVMRHFGYYHLPATLPTLGGVDAGSNPEHERAGRARRSLAGWGYAEAIHYAFQERAWDAAYPRPEAAGPPLALANPLSERLAVLRRSLVPNLAASAEHNARHGAAGVRLFELGHLFPAADAPELEAVALVAGGRSAEGWDGGGEIDLLAVKGVCEALVERLGARATARPAELAGVLAGTGAVLLDAEGNGLGWLGRLERAETPFALFAAEILLDRLPRELAPMEVAPPPRLPGISADLTLTHPVELAWSELARAIASLAAAPLAGFRLKERYQGAGVPAGAVATTIAFDYHGGDRTLTQEEVNERHAALAAELERRFAVAREEGR
jgi:phenylalanyl-tRNA synthetase beta chain